MIIAHLTSAHPRFDTRIYQKMCLSLTKIGQVYLVCADGKEDEVIDNVNILDVGKSKNRFQRMTSTVNLIYKKAIKLNADIYHLHDPELIRIGTKLIKSGKKVIFDSHEDVGDQILNKYYIPKIFRGIISNFYNKYERFKLSKFNGLIGATPYITQKLDKIHKHNVNVNNYPKFLNKKVNTSKIKNETHEICYFGAITKIRGLLELINALTMTKNNVKLNLAGKINPKEFEIELKKTKGWSKVNYLGFMESKKIIETFNNKIGIVTYLKVPNHEFAQPNKFYEYMNYKLPIICSNFNLWKTFLDQYKCGLYVEPSASQDIAKKIDYLIDNPVQSSIMGENGYNAVKDNYNWDLEEKKLFSFYEKIFNN